MVIRQKLLQAATAALYMGPLLAGLAGFGWVMLAPFLSVFLLWQMVLRPQYWPQTNSDWLRADTWVSLLTKVLSQLLLISVLFGIGRGIGGVMGFVPLFHPALPIAISFIAIPVSRLFWDPEQALALDQTSEALHDSGEDPDGGLVSAPGISADETVAPLLDLPEDAPMQQVGSALDDVLDDSEAWARLAALGEALDAAPGKHRVLREALLIWATDVDLIQTNCAPGALQVAFRVAGDDKPLLSRLLPRATALARAMPQRHPQFPDGSALEALKARAGLKGQLANDLDALLEALGHVPDRAAQAAKRSAPRTASSTSMA